MHLLFGFSEVNCPNKSCVDGTGKLIEIVADALKLVRNFIGSVDAHDLFFENTVADKIADAPVMTVGVFLDPNFFFRCDTERKNDIFVFFFHRKTPFVNN